MPLVKGKSEHSFKKNVETEMHAGKPQKQALAIAYAQKRKAQAKKMAEGGQITDNYQSSCDEHCVSPCMVHPQADALDQTEMYHEKANASAMSEDESMVDRIMKQRKLSEGGMVANEDHGHNDNELAGFDPNEFDDLALRDDLKSTYGDDDNSGDSLDNAQEDEDRKDMVARIMKSRAKKDKLPNPR